MVLINQWRQSLGLLVPANFKLFLLVSLKTTLRALHGWLIPFGLLWVVWRLQIFFFAVTGTSTTSGISFVNVLFLFLPLVLLCRASLIPRTWRASSRACSALLFLFFVNKHHTCGVWGRLDSTPTLEPSLVPLVASYALLSILTFFVLFVLDMPCSLRGVWWAVRGTCLMVLYNLPGLLGILAVTSCGVALIYAFMVLLQAVVASVMHPLFAQWLLTGLCAPLYAFASFPLWVNFYTKRVYDNATLYRS